MPHKHTRREKDPSSYDLPPSQIAAPLPVAAPSRKNKPAPKNKTPGAQAGIKRKRGSEQKDDAPRAFKRLMAFAEGKRIKPGLDDGQRRTTKKKGKDADNAGTTETTSSTVEKPVIKPGERMSDFAARVDAALPLGGLITKTVRNGKDPLGLKVYRTKKERKMHKLYDEWREEERKIKERREEEQAEAEEQELENDELGVSWKVDLPGMLAGKKKGKKGKQKDDDPWEELKRKRGETRIGLNDTVQAPPKLPDIMSKKPFSRGATGEAGKLPKSAGDARRQQELAKARVEVLAAYSRMKGSKKKAGTRDI